MYISNKKEMKRQWMPAAIALSISTITLVSLGMAIATLIAQSATAYQQRSSVNSVLPHRPIDGWPD